MAQNDPLVVATSSGQVQGSATDGVRSFLGIPFAAPPLGELRFRPPVAAPAWTGVRAATTLPPPCPQAADDGSVTGSEDCLQLNVWARTDATAAPVMVFIHGGGNQKGSTSGMVRSSLLYDGGRIVQARPVVVVTVQYRLGVLGFMAHPALSGESEHGSSGNYGLLDLVAALGWVRDNIAAFGGDPARVMIFGESAGALNTCMLVASPLAQGLFTSALMESGGCRAQSMDTQVEAGVAIAKSVGCDSAECLRAVSAANLVTAQGGGPVEYDGTLSLGSGPVVDGWVLPAQPLQMIAEGRHNRVPIIVGANADETSAFVAPFTAAAYRAKLTQIFGPLIGALVLRKYPVSDYESARAALVAVTTDVQFVCPCRTIAETLTAAQAEPVYRYFFTHTPAGAEARGAFHGLELTYVFQHFEDAAAAKDLAVQRSLLDYWTSLATVGDPNGAGQPAWPRYAKGSDRYMELAAPPAAGDGVRTAKCDFWEMVRKLAGLGL